MAAAFDLDRFVTAQNPVYPDVASELRTGRKRTHWMWFIFPQLRGLGSSSTAQFYGIASLEEAKAYLAHPVLGPRLRACTEWVNIHSNASLEEIFGYPDHLKFVSSMTLFAEAAEGPAPFKTALERFAKNRPDSRTLALLGR